MLIFSTKCDEYRYIKNQQRARYLPKSISPILKVVFEVFSNIFLPESSTSLPAIISYCKRGKHHERF